MKLVRLLAAAVVITLAAGAIAPAVHGQDSALRYRWTKGQSLRYRTVQESNISMSGIPGAGDMTLTTMVTEVHLITASDIAADGTATLSLKYESMKLDLTTPMGNMSIDSAASGPPVDPSLVDAQKMFQALVGESVTVVMAPTGAVKSVDGMTRISAKIKAAVPATSALGGVMASLDSMLSDEALKGTMGQSFANLPDKVVKPGETWQTTLNMPNPLGAMTVANTFTAKGVERVEGKDVTRVGVAQKVSVAPGGTIGPMSVTVSDGTGEGDMLVDHRLGQIVRSTTRQTLPMTMSLSAPDGTSMSLTGIAKTNVTMTLVDR
ncbi:MAG TPA: DUF6263 family protein [Vicinamibacterales bacterium]|nr:DUF6263 family protein [Vicinamibacterales bacterium]